MPVFMVGHGIVDANKFIGTGIENHFTAGITLKHAPCDSARELFFGARDAIARCGVKRKDSVVAIIHCGACGSLRLGRILFHAHHSAHAVG